MRKSLCFGIAALMIAALAVGAFAFQSKPQPAAAQDATGVSCDSTLYLLLILAEQNYGFLSSMDEATISSMPMWNYGPYTNLLNDTVTYSQNMATSRTPEDQVNWDALHTAVQGYAGLDTNTILQSYDASMGYTPSTDMTPLTPGNVTNEAPECAALRTQLEQFLISHLVAERQLRASMGNTGTDSGSDGSSTEATEEATEAASGG